MTAEALVLEEETDEIRSGVLLPATIRAARDGDSRAFEEIMLATERRLATLAWRILGDAEEVKEALQETYLRLFRHFGRYDARQDFFGWLYRITVNVCRDFEKRRRRRRFFAPIEEAFGLRSAAIPADDQMERQSDLSLLAKAIDSLPRKERLAIILRDVEELPTEQVALILGSTPATVRVQISKARAKLRRWMEAVRGGTS